jgi:hypothetical protein
VLYSLLSATINIKDNLYYGNYLKNKSKIVLFLLLLFGLSLGSPREKGGQYSTASKCPKFSETFHQLFHQGSFLEQF